MLRRDERIARRNVFRRGDEELMKIRPEAMLEAITEKMESVDDPRHRSLLTTVREHIAAELDGRDVGRVMATMVEEPQFHWYGFGRGDVGPKGREAVEAGYARLLGDHCNLHQHEFRRIVVDDHNVVLEGPLHMVYPGSALAARGMEVDDAESYYRFSYDVCAIFHFDEDARCTGEDSYGDGGPSAARLVKLEPDELPDSLLR